MLLDFSAAAALTALALTIPTTAQLFTPKASPKPQYPKYGSVVAIGASYQDNGHSRPQQYQSSLGGWPYSGGRRTNGPVMVESLFSMSGASRLYDYALAGAMVDDTVKSGSVPDTKSQIANYLADVRSGYASRADRTLIVYWNGILTVMGIWQDTMQSQDTKTAFSRIDAALQSLDNQILQLQTMSGSQTNDIIILPIPPLEIVPNSYFAVNGDQGYLNFLGQLTTRFNNGISTIYNSATARRTKGQRIFGDDVAGLWRDATANPRKYGLTDAKNACWTWGQQVCSDASTRLYFDTLHPTTSFYNYMAKRLWSYVNTPL